MVRSCAYCLDINLILFCDFLLKQKKNLVIFSAEVNRYYVSCVCNFSYSFTPILLKLYRCLGYGLKMCILFGYNSHIICITLKKMNLVIF